MTKGQRKLNKFKRRLRKHRGNYGLIADMVGLEHSFVQDLASEGERAVNPAYIAVNDVEAILDKLESET